MAHTWHDWKAGDEVRRTDRGEHRFPGVILYFTSMLVNGVRYNVAVCDWRWPNGALFQEGVIVGHLEYAFAARDRFHNCEARDDDATGEALVRETFRLWRRRARAA